MLRTTPTQYRIFTLFVVFSCIWNIGFAQGCPVNGSVNACLFETNLYTYTGSLSGGEYLEWESSGMILDQPSAYDVNVQWNDSGNEYLMFRKYNAQGVELSMCQFSVQVSQNSFPEFNFQSDIACTGDTSIFTISNTFNDPQPVVISWTIDGEIVQESSSKELHYIFSNSGNYEICAQATDGICTSNKYCNTIEIEAPPNAPEITLPGLEEQFPLTVCIDQMLMFASDQENTVWKIIHQGSGTEWNYSNAGELLSFQPTMSGQYLLQAWSNSPNGNCTGPVAEHTFHVSSDAAVEVICPSLVCVGETVTYTAIANCQDYQWEVSEEGTIVSGQGTETLEVLWDEIPPGYGCGTVILNPSNCSGTDCTDHTVVNVPILSDSVDLENGPMFSCSSVNYYSLPGLGGVEYHWELEELERLAGNDSVELTDTIGNFSSIESGDFFGSVLLRITGTHPIAGCLFEIEKTIRLRPYTLSLSSEIPCEGEAFTAEIQPTIAGDEYFHWEYLDQEITDTSGTFEGTYEYDGSVSVSIETPYGSCSLSDIVQGNRKPNILSLEGAREVCLDSSYQYMAEYTEADHIYWKVTDGSTVTNYSDVFMIEHSWSDPNGPYTLEVWAENTTDSFVCMSDTTSIQITAETGMEPHIMGDTEVCPESQSSYSVMPDGGQSFNWTILGNQGSIVEGQGSHEIEVQWLGVAQETTVPITVETDYCGTVLNDTIEVILKPFDLNMAIPDTICPGEQINFEVEVANAGMITWYIDGDIVGTGNDFPYTFSESGTFAVSVKVSNPMECPGIYSAMQQVVVLSIPEVQVQAQNFPICNEFGELVEDVTLSINVPPDNADSIQWYYNGGQLPGATSPVFITDRTGDFSATIFIQGCEVMTGVHPVLCPGQQDSCSCDPPVSQDITSVNYSSGDECGYVDVLGDISPSIDDVNNPYWSFMNYDGNGTFEEIIDDEFGLIQNGIGPYEAPGYYPFSLNSTYTCPDSTTCPLLATDVIKIPLIAQIEQHLICTDTGYVLELVDATRTVDSTSALSSNWEVDGSPSGSSESISIPLVEGETVEVCLEASSSASNYSCTDCIEVTAPVKPELEIYTTNADSTSGCLFNPVTFIASIDSSNVLGYEWTFEDSSFSINHPVTKTFDTTGQQIVHLEVELVSGCVLETTDTISIDTPPSLDLEIQKSLLSCDRAAQLIVSDTTYNEYIWSTGDTTKVPEIIVHESGMYSVKVVTPQGCSIESNPISVMVNNDFPTDISGPVEICEESNQSLYVPHNSELEYEWNVNPNVGGIQLTLSYLSLEDFPTGVYDIFLTIAEDDSTVCDTLEHSLVVHPNPSLDVTKTVEQCQPFTAQLCVHTGDSVQVSYMELIEGGEPTSTYPDTNCFALSENGFYTITATNQFGCTSDTFIQIENAIDLSPFLDGCYTLCIEDVEQGNVTFPAVPGNYTYWEYRFYDKEEEVPSQNYNVLDSGNFSIPEMQLQLPQQEGQVTLYVETDSCSRESEPFCYESEECLDCPAGSVDAGNSTTLCLYGSNYDPPTMYISGYIKYFEGFTWCEDSSFIEWDGAEFEINNSGYDTFLSDRVKFGGVLFINDEDILEKEEVSGTIYLCDEEGNLCPFDFTIHLQSSGMCEILGMMCVNWEYTPYLGWETGYPQVDQQGNYTYYRRLVLPFILSEPECEITDYTVNVYGLTGMQTFLAYSESWDNPVDTIPHTVYDAIYFSITSSQYSRINGFEVEIINNCGDTCTYTLPKGSPPRLSKERHKNTWFVYPNPADKSFYIDYKGGKAINESVLVSIYNTVGKRVEQEKYDDIPIKIDNPGWPNGLYWIKIQNGSEESEVVPIVID